MADMPALTRRRSKDAHAEKLADFLWRRAGRDDRDPRRRPVDVDQWGRSCGFYPGSEPGEYLSGTAATFDRARAEFGKAWYKQRFRCSSARARSLTASFIYLARRRALSEGGSIRKSLSFFPDLSCAVSQRGCFPRPVQVSDGCLGFLYFGTTLAYGRRARLTCSSLVSTPWPSCRSRCSS